MYTKIILIVSVLMFAVPVQAKLYQDYDKFKEVLHEETGQWGGFIGLNELDGGVLLSMVPLRTTYKDKTEVYKLKIQWSGREILILRNVTMILSIDGENIELKPALEHVGYLIDATISSSDVLERAEFIVTSELIERIASANSVECVLYTARGRLERSFGRSNFKIFKEFVEKVIKKK